MPGALASGVTLSAGNSFQIADGYSTSIVTATTGNPGDSVDFTIIDSAGSHHVIQTTDGSGSAIVSVGPYPYGVPEDVTIKASCSGINSNTQTIKFLAKNDLTVIINPDTTVSVGTPMTVIIDWGVPGIPLTFTAFDPGYHVIHSQTVTTDSTGCAYVYFILSDMAGYNWVTVGLNGATAKSMYIKGSGGTIDHFQLSTAPHSPIYADGKTSYTLRVLALDSKNNIVPGKNVTVYKDDQYYLTYPTNGNGVLAVNIGPSAFVQDVKLTVVANDTLATDSINVSYIKGIASNVSLMVNPPVVANGNISTVPGQAEVHTAEITSTLTDYWGHPIAGERVYIKSLNTSLGMMYDSANNVPVDQVSGITSDGGQYTYDFRLNSNVSTSDVDIGVPIMTWYKNATTGVDTSAIEYVKYTDKPFVIATTSFSPSSNLSVNDTIDVTVKIRACGWVNATNFNNSAMLVFDTSGSMDWLANTIYPTNGKPLNGTLTPATSLVDMGSSQYKVANNNDWQPLATYHYTCSTVQDLQFMLSSDFRAYNGGSGSFYFLKVVDPNGNTFRTDNGGMSAFNGIAEQRANENSVKFTNAANGDYTIYGAYKRNGANPDYNLMVLTDPKRLGQSTDLDSAAKIAGSEFVSLMDKNQVGVVWFNDSYAAPPTADFVGNPTVINAGQSVQFTDLSINSPTTYLWDFGDGNTSTDPSPLHKYWNYGVYNVQLTVTNLGGTDSCLKSGYITVHHAIPTASFTGTPLSGYGNVTVAFTDTSGDTSVTGRLWDFGDGNTSTSTSSHKYYNPNPYPIYFSPSLTLTNDGGTSAPFTRANYIVVYPYDQLPVADFSFSPASPGVKEKVTFTNLSTGANITAIKWDFGDATSSTTANITHQYSTAKTYTVKLTVTNNAGSSTKTKTVTVVKNPLPVVDFVGTPLSGTAPLTVTFTNLSTALNVQSRSWSWGDNTSNFTQANNPKTHTYNNPGTYTVMLTLTNDNGSATCQKINYITVTTPSPTPTATATATPTPTPIPVADFTANQTSGYPPLAVQFSDRSTNSPTSWSWDFGDGNVSTSQNPLHVYYTPGKYSVTLVATNSAGSSLPVTKTNYITVLVHNPLPHADFTMNKSTGTVPTTIKFTNTSTGGNIYARSWDWGDGTATYTGTTNPMTHTYTSAGTYTVSLTVTNDAGSDTKTATVTISNNPPPVVSFTTNKTTGTVPTTILFTNTSTGANILTRTWDWGDGSPAYTGTSNTPTHTYSANGAYVVTFTLTNDGGSDSKQTTIVVSNNPKPVASFTGTPTSGNTPLSVAFTSTSTGNNIYSYAWDFGDGTTTTVASPTITHVYTKQDLYTVSLTVTNDGGSDTATLDNYIKATNPLPTMPPMLAGILAGVLKPFSIDVIAQSAQPMTPAAGTAISLTTVGSTTSAQIDNAINSLSSYGGTNVAAGIRQAIGELNGPNFTPGNRKYILLLTDGYSQYPDDDIAAAYEAKAQNITIYTVGIGMPDDATMQNIASITGGTYTKVSNMPDLVNTFSAIANNMTDTAGSNISMSTYSNYTDMVNPDAIYVAGSTNITLPNGMVVHREPAIQQDVGQQIYKLQWDNLGNLQYNQNITIKYKLKLMTAGNITPILSPMVSCTDKDGNTIYSYGDNITTYVNGTNPLTPGLASPDLEVTIVNPTNNSTVTSQRLLISWYTHYTGTDKYDQMILLNGVQVVPTSNNGYSGDASRPWQMTLDISKMPSGPAVLEIHAYDSYCGDPETVNFTIDHSPGKIQLDDG